MSLRPEASRDADVAWRISSVELGERLSTTRFSQLQSVLSGEKSKRALQILADESQFLDPPAADTPSTSPPEISEQRRIMGLVVSYVSKTIPQLPNFFATRDTIRFEDTPQLQLPDRPFLPYEPIHFVGRSQATVLYHDGREVVETNSISRRSDPFTEGLTTWGVFGPILGTVIVDAAKSNLQWSHWERDENHPDQLLAAFRFDVPQARSHYEINYCCVAHQSATAVAKLEPYRHIVGYRGRMTIDPGTGAILRLVVEADLKPTDPVTQAAILVDYGAVEIGGRSYLCPRQSISRTVAQSVQLDPIYKYPVANHIQPLKTSMNEVAFENYHMFRADSRVLTPQEAELVKQTLPAASPTVAEPVSAEQPTPQPNTKDTSSAASPAEDAPPVPASSAAIAVPNAAPPEPVTPELSETAANTVPDLPLKSEPDSPGSGFKLRTTTRLVDVSVVAYDKQGRPITNLKPEDFEIEDNGVRQQIRFLSPPGEAANRTAAKDSAMLPDHGFSNRDLDAAVPQNGIANPEGNITILMIDESNLAFADLGHARDEMLRFLRTLPKGESVGLYVMNSARFRVLLEPTLDTALIESTLKKWTPDAQALAHAQEEEQRNRQQMDYVHNVGDLFYVNGNLSTGQFDYLSPIDPQLRSLGDNPTRDAIAVFYGIARHLAELPGHKTLVWIASDNVLADFSDKAPHSEKGPAHVDRLQITAREALNEAHVSLYPLDASQLEAGGISASLFATSVQPAPGSNVGMQIGTLPPAERQEAEEALANSQRNIKPGRTTAQMQQDTHSIRGEFRDLAQATGGRALRRASDIAAELNSIVADGDAVYLLSFSPSQPPDDAYHHLTVKVRNRREVTLRYRSGYLYSKEPATLKDRFRDAVWKPTDISEIATTAQPEPDSKGSLLKLNIAATDLGLTQQGERWEDKVGIFLVERDNSGLHSKLTGRRLALSLKPATYQNTLQSGLNIEERVDPTPEDGSFRIIIVDENSGRIGSVTVPIEALKQKK